MGSARWPRAANSRPPRPNTAHSSAQANARRAAYLLDTEYADGATSQDKNLREALLDLVKVVTENKDSAGSDAGTDRPHRLG